MDYPLNMTKPAKPNEHASSAGFAVANDADEHQALSDMGYEPKLEADGDEAEAPKKTRKTKA